MTDATQYFVPDMDTSDCDAPFPSSATFTALTCGTLLLLDDNGQGHDVQTELGSTAIGSQMTPTIAASLILNYNKYLTALPSTANFTALTVANKVVDTQSWVTGNVYLTALPSTANLTTLTVSVWVKFSSLNAVSLPITIYDKGYDGSAEGFYLRLVSTNPGSLNVGTYTNAGGNFGATSSTVLTTGTWYNIVGQYTGTAWNIYLNGTLNTTFTSATGPQISSAPISIGAASISGAYDRFLNGNIANVQVYNRALSSTEVLQNYNALKTRFGL